MKCRFGFLASLLAVLFGSAWLNAVPLSGYEKNNVSVYEKARASVVNITAVTLQQDFFFDIVPQQGQGSGAVVSPKGYIVTNDHVVGKAAKVEVTFLDKTTYPARVVGTDPDSDLAVIQVVDDGPKKRKFVHLEYGDPTDLAVGRKVLAIGNPFGLGGSLSVGVISSLDRSIRTQTDRLIKDVIQTDAAINPGNSGGPLLNRAAELIGVNSQILSRSGGSHGIGFAINVKTVKMVVQQLISFGKVLRPDLGIDAVAYSSGLLAALKKPVAHGVMLVALRPGGLAMKAGLKAARREVVMGFRRIPFDGDIIYQVDSLAVKTERDLLDYLFEKKAGETVTLHYVRGAKKFRTTVRLELPRSGLKQL